MSRSLARRTIVLTAAAACLGTAALPALAATSDQTKVTYVVADGTRQFKVTELDGSTPLADFQFDTTLRKPFRTIVNDVNRPLLSQGYQVNASMTNLYLKEGSGHSWTEFIPSKNLALAYESSLAGTSTLPVLPRVNLAGTIGTCADQAVADALGITKLTSPLPLLSDPLFTALSPLMQTVCTELGQATVAARTVDVTAHGTTEMITAPLSLSNLPFTLTGGEGGRFTSPSYQGTIASGDPSKSGTATSKRIMTGSPLATTGDLSLLFDALTAVLATRVSPNLVGGAGSADVTLQGALAAISAENAPLASTISRLTVVDQLDLVKLLARTLVDVDLTALTTVTGQYDAYPVLQTREYAAKAGTYEGTLIVDFFETGS